MKVKDVIVLKEVADDLNDGKAFYDQREIGVVDDITYVVAVLPMRRNPSWIKRKLKRRS